MKKRIFAIAVCMCLLLAVLPAAASASDYVVVLKGGYVYMDEALPENELIYDGILGSGSAEEGYTYTVRGGIHHESAMATAFRLEDDKATLNIVDSFRIDGGSAADDTYGIYAVGDLTITGGSTLRVNAGNSTKDQRSSNAIYAEGALVIDGATVIATGGSAKGGSIGLYGGESLTVRSGSVIAIGGPAEAASVAIGSLNDILISGGTVGATAGSGPVGSAIMGMNIEITGGTVEADAADADTGYGLASGNKNTNGILITGGEVTAQASTWASALTNHPDFRAIAPRTQGLEVTAGTNADGSGAAVRADWKGDGSDDVSTCKYLKIASRHTHGNATYDPGKEAHCAVGMDGVKPHYICSCGQIFYDEACTKPVENTDDLIIPGEHTGGTATCNSNPKCAVCGSKYGFYDLENHTSEDFRYEDFYHDGTHMKRYACCGEMADAYEPCSFGDDNICDLCGYERPASDSPTDPTDSTGSTDPTEPGASESTQPTLAGTPEGTQPDGTPAPTQPAEPGSGGGGFPWWIVLLAVAAVAAAAAGVILLKKRK